MKRFVLVAVLLMVSMVMMCGSAFAELYTSDTLKAGEVSAFGYDDTINLFNTYSLLSFTTPSDVKYWTVFNNFMNGYYPAYVNPKASDSWYTLDDLRFIDVSNFSLTNWNSIVNYGWTDIKADGEWTVASKFGCSPETWNFEIAAPPVSVPVPEPISSSLFLLGAGALGSRMLRKKRA